MKKKNFIRAGRLPGMLLGAAFCTILLLPAGCSNDSEISVSDSDGRVPLQVSGGINVLTRAHDAQWDKDDLIGIYMYAAGKTDIAEEAANIPYKKTDTGDGFTPVNNPIHFPIDGSNVDFHAWYPYNDVTGSDWTVDLTDQRQQAALDLMVADVKSSTQEGGTVYNKEHPAVRFNFEHRLTKLVLKITNGIGIKADDLKGLKVEITKQWKTATYDPEFDVIGFVQELAPVTLLTNADGTSSEAILFPDDLTGQSLTTGRELVFTLQGSNEKFYWSVPDDKSFNSGEKNIYTITINRTSLDVTSTITDWTQGNGSGESGSAQ